MQGWKLCAAFVSVWRHTETKCSPRSQQQQRQMGAPTSLNTTSNQSSLNTTSNQSPAPFSPGPSCEWLKHLLAVELAPLKSQVTDLKTANESLESRVTDLTSQMEEKAQKSAVADLEKKLGQEMNLVRVCFCMQACCCM